MSEKPFEGVKITAQIQVILPEAASTNRVDFEFPFTKPLILCPSEVAAWLTSHVNRSIETAFAHSADAIEKRIKESNDRPKD